MDIRDCADNLSGVLDSAALVVSQGRLLVMPTDTVYGVGADAFNPAAVANLLAAKGRGRDMPPPVLVASEQMAEALADGLPEEAHTLISAFWPGALTIVVTAQPALAWDLGDTQGTVALRMPDSDIARQLLERTGPLAVSSANTTGNPAAITAAGAADMLGESVSLYLDGGPAPGQVASTIVDLTGHPARILREGAIDRDQIAALIELEPEPESDSESEPGAAPDTAGGPGDEAEEVAGTQVQSTGAVDAESAADPFSAPAEEAGPPPSRTAYPEHTEP
ncbi:MAG: L-threonylcarbamoyladenylate synthase [Flaviflexus sp.]|nr:L-threonylcarbamoyladenylate synthase [Flaviflexus sp.]